MSIVTTTENAKIKNNKKIKESAAVSVTGDRWLTVDEAAAIAGIKVNTMYTCCLRRVLASYKIGDKMRRIKASDLIAWLESSRVEPIKSR